MNLGKPLTFLSMMFATSPLATACSSSSAGAGKTDAASAIAALDAPNGALVLTSKEAPAFGDPEVEALPTMDDALVTQINPKSLANAAVSASGGIAYRVAVVWGHLPLAHDKTSTDIAPSPAQWTGSLQVDTGAIGPMRTIAFDSGDRLDPMTTPRAISFRSKTDAYVGGVLVRIVIPQGDEPTLHVATNLLSVDVDLSRLTDSAGGIERAADGVAGVGWLGFREDRCVRGFVLGRWVKDQRELGRSLGAVSDANGALLGYVRGAWGYTPARSGEVWFDKYIDVDGNPKGLAFGWYGDGFYRGLWAAAGEHDVSALDVSTTEGLYSDAQDTGDGRGVWLGRWSAPCMP